MTMSRTFDRAFYVSGPMIGHPQHNYPAFYAAAALLRERGHAVVNPAEINDPSNSRIECLRNDVRAMVDCDSIYLLKGWHDSLGACLELHIAIELGFHIEVEPGAQIPFGKFKLC